MSHTPGKSLYHGDTLPRGDFGVYVSVYTGTRKAKRGCRMPWTGVTGNIELETQLQSSGTAANTLNC